MFFNYFNFLYKNIKIFMNKAKSAILAGFIPQFNIGLPVLPIFSSHPLYKELVDVGRHGG